jgi:para-nitrobenzyl esterase
MKSKLLLVLFVAVASLLSLQSQGQTRYQDSIFASYTLDTVTYSTVWGLKMNVYQPVGDVQATRPLIVLAHGGSFISGNRDSDFTITQLCADFAHKGYVAVSIDYTLEYNPGNFLNGDSAAREVFQAVSDGKAAVRYFYKDAASTNTYKIDTNNIFIGGNSAGAVLFMQYAYMNDTSKLDSNNFQAIINSVGGLNGNSGNDGYSSNFKAVINLAGALNEPQWISYCSAPIVSAQGTADIVVPYTCMDPVVYGFSVPLELCGLGSLQPYINGNVPFSASMVFQGAGHVPWDTSATDFYMIDTMITNFLYAEVTGTAPSSCGPIPAGVQTINKNTIDMYPNPANSELNIRSSAFISHIAMMDEMGRTVSEAKNINSLSYQMNTSNLSSGIYFVSIYNAQGQVPTVRKVTIE